jgi:hypothetical protein
MLEKPSILDITSKFYYNNSNSYTYTQYLMDIQNKVLNYGKEVGTLMSILYTDSDTGGACISIDHKWDLSGINENAVKDFKQLLANICPEFENTIGEGLTSAGECLEIHDTL